MKGGEYMKYFISTSNHPHYNQALEHYLFYHFDEDILLLYVNQPSVIIGRHQNPWKEIHLDVLESKGMVLSRRLSGGGTVYHDEGNLNFAFIYNGSSRSTSDNFHYVTEQLKSLDIQLIQSKRKDLLYKKYKVSGNAFYNRGKRRLHHGTLLINADLNVLWSVLRFDHEDFKDKSVVSIKSDVMNLKTVYPSLTVKKVMMSLKGDLVELEGVDLPKDLMDKYTGDHWLYGETPNFEYWNASYKFKVCQGRIVESEIKSLIDKKFEIHKIKKEVENVSRVI